MLVLGIETTCDETGCALVVEGKTILSNVVFSQIEVHSKFGGVVPEAASRCHFDACDVVLEKALLEASKKLSNVDLIAVAKGPGLIGALLVGIEFAKGLSLGLEKPLIGVNHVEAHLYAATMENCIEYPALGVVVSGGHTSLVLMNEDGTSTHIGKTRDDAVGEAFDKVGSMLGLPYPGGPEIEKLAKKGDPLRYLLKAGKIKDHPYDFSFSGLKTAVLYAIKGQNAANFLSQALSEQEKCDLAASFQHAALSDVVLKAVSASIAYQCKSIVIGGGVSCNEYLRSLFLQKSSLPVYFPSKELCLDNAAMIAGLGYSLFMKDPSFQASSIEASPRIILN